MSTETWRDAAYRIAQRQRAVAETATSPMEQQPAHQPAPDVPTTTVPPSPVAPSRIVIGVTWDQVPHLTPEAKATLLATIHPHLREARSKGVPHLGTGAIYPVPESEIRVADIPIPKHWPRGYALDAATSGPTAAVWMAHDRDSATLYITSVYKRAQAEPSIHAAAVLARGAWMRGVGDVAGVTNADGDQFLDIYRRLGLKIELADKAVEAGIQDTWELLSTGRLKVFGSCEAWFEEYRLYRRDAKGRIVKRDDHLMDCTRMLVRGQACMRTEEPERKPQQFDAYTDRLDAVPPGLKWMA
jgi:hypothetical protein